MRTTLPLPQTISIHCTPMRCPPSYLSQRWRLRNSSARHLKVLSYFVATGHVKEDKGFAIKGWENVRFENDNIITVGNVGMAMGNYFFTDPNDVEAKVEYSFGYILDDMGEVRIHLPHSSMPYNPSV